MITTNRQSARVLWAEVEPSTALQALYEQVSSVLEKAGLPSDRHPTYSPHVTLARLKGGQPEQVKDFLGHYATYSPQSFGRHPIVLVLFSCPAC